MSINLYEERYMLEITLVNTALTTGKGDAMSGALAITSVTTVLKHLLGNALIQQSAAVGMGDVTITSVPPDRVPTGVDEHAQLNLHLYRLTPNTGWRRTGMATTQGEQQDDRPLALDLHYLLTAYGEQDYQTEVLLGYAIQCFYEMPILTRETLRSSLASSASNNGGNAPLAAVSLTTLAEQLEQIKISPEFLSLDEMSKLWSSLQTRARLSVAYQVSMILIENRQAAVLADVS
jgi:hypothetical protein